MSDESEKKAVVLLSGGLDSATCLALALKEGFSPYPLTFNYGQRHAVELQAVNKIASSLGVRAPQVVKIDLRQFGGSALTADLPVPQKRNAEEMAEGIPITYVPARNTILLAYALAFAEVLGAADIFIGVNAVDYSGYPDCRPEFIRSFEKMANLATKAAVEGRSLTIHAPLIELTKAEIIQLGTKLGLDYSLTHSCYDPAEDGAACGRCDSCLLRKKGFLEAGLADPTRYADKKG